METNPIKAVEMVRAIRDAFYERTKDFSGAELREYIASEAATFRREMKALRLQSKGAGDHSVADATTGPELPAKRSA